MILTIANEPMYWIERLYMGSLFVTRPFESADGSTTVKRARPPRTDYFREQEHWRLKVSRNLDATVVTITRAARTAVSDPMFWIGRRGGASSNG